MRLICLSTALHLCTSAVFSQWQPDVRLTNDTATSYTAYCSAWSIATVGNVVHIVWFDSRDGGSEIYYKRSTDGGVSWGMDTRLSNAAGLSEFPSISASASDVHVCWGDERDGALEIYYKRSTDGGMSWGADTRLTYAAAYSSYPSTAVSGPIVHAAWEDARDGDLEIYYKRSTDGGTSWGADTRLTNSVGGSENPSIAVSGTVVHVVWNDDRDGNNETYYKRSTDGGVTWGADTRLTNDRADGSRSALFVAGPEVHVVWYDERDGNREIYYKRSTDAGVSWGADTRLTIDLAPSNNPTVSVSGPIVHLVWHDERDGNKEVYYKRSTDGGLNWGADTRITNAAGTSGRPSVSVSGQAVHVVWYDDRDGNSEVYYTQDPTGNVVGIDELPGNAPLFSVYPNPAHSELTVVFSAMVHHGSIVVTSVLGETAYREAIPATSSMRMQLSDLPNGIYFIAVYDGQRSQSQKVVIEK